MPGNPRTARCGLQAGQAPVRRGPVDRVQGDAQLASIALDGGVWEPSGVANYALLLFVCGNPERLFGYRLRTRIRSGEHPMSNGHYLTLNEVARLTGRAKSTISKALRTGKISYVSHDPVSKAYQIDPAEALRVFPRKQETASDDQSETRSNTKLSFSGNSALGGELEALRERFSMIQHERERERDQLTDQIEDLRKRLDLAEAARERLTAQLTDQRSATPTGKPNLWARLFGRGSE